MMYPIRLKTGFFETAPCTLSIRYEGVTLNSPGDKHGDIRVARDDIIAVTITMKRYPRFEIQTHEKMFSGIFSGDVDCGELERQFRGSLGSRVIIEKE